MPRGIYQKLKCDEFHGPFTAQEHQKFVRNYFIKSPYKGLLLYHRLGSGKTCSSIIIGDALLRMKKITHVYVFTPGSLRSGWIKEYCGVCGKNAKTLENRYTFVTYNYNVANELPLDFNDSLVVIDEVHNLINSVKNTAKNATAIYNRIKNSNCKILALSGTPIFNNVYEWPILGNLLKPGAFPEVLTSSGLNQDNFMDLFTIEQDGTLIPKHPDAFQKALSGIISYFPGTSAEMYPELIKEPIIKVPMTPEQEAKYWIAYNTEQKFISFGMPKPQLKHTNPANYEYLKRMYIIAKKRIISRQPSNFVYPSDIYQNEPEERPKDALYPVGWVEKKYFNDHQLRFIYSTKFTALFNNILDHFNGKHMVFTFFKEHSGVNIIKAILDMCDMRAEVFSGDLSDIGRKKLLREFNSVENRYGNKIKVLLVTDAGAEGITLLETAHIHILESDVRENKIQQAIGRAVRYKSHIKMPPSERVVHLWRYWSISSHPYGTKFEEEIDTITTGGEIATQKVPITVIETIDELLYEAGQIKMRTLNSFMDLLIEASIENHATE